MPLVACVLGFKVLFLSALSLTFSFFFLVFVFVFVFVLSKRDLAQSAPSDFRVFSCLNDGKEVG